MNAMNLEQDAFLSVLKMELGARYTEEQLDLIRRFGDGPTFCFASPGTGKTFTAVGGLINAELHKAIPGQNIYAMLLERHFGLNCCRLKTHRCVELIYCIYS